MCDFDWNWPKAIDREAVERVLALGFIERSENVVLVAPQGLGKTMLAKNIVHAAVLAGHSALFITASELLLDLAKQESARARDRRLRQYAGFHVLAIDEIGYLAYDLFLITAPSLRLNSTLDRARLELTLDRLTPRLLLLDPLVRLHRGDEICTQRNGTPTRQSRRPDV